MEVVSCKRKMPWLMAKWENGHSRPPYFLYSCIIKVIFKNVKISEIFLLHWKIIVETLSFPICHIQESLSQGLNYRSLVTDHCVQNTVDTKTTKIKGEGFRTSGHLRYGLNEGQGEDSDEEGAACSTDEGSVRGPRLLNMEKWDSKACEVNSRHHCFITQ